MAFIRVGDILVNRRFSKRSSQRTVDAILIVSEWHTVMEKLHCVEKFARARPLSFKDGKLTIQAASSALTSELKMCEGKILQEYAKLLQINVVESLVIRRH